MPLIPQSDYQPSREIDPDQLEMFPEDINYVHTTKPDPFVHASKQAEERIWSEADLKKIEFVDLTNGMGQYRGYSVHLTSNQLEAVCVLIANYVAEDLIAKARALTGASK